MGWANVIDFHLKSCIVGQKCKNNITGRSLQERGLRTSPTKSEENAVLEVENFGLKVCISRPQFCLPKALRSS
jgi:hypothetical protein